MATDPTLPDRQRARATLRLGKRTRLRAEVDVTSAGLLAIGALVSSILLATTLLVRVAVRESKALPAPRSLKEPSPNS